MRLRATASPRSHLATHLCCRGFLPPAAKLATGTLPSRRTARCRRRRSPPSYSAATTHLPAAPTPRAVARFCQCPRRACRGASVPRPLPRFDCDTRPPLVARARRPPWRASSHCQKPRSWGHLATCLMRRFHAGQRARRPRRRSPSRARVATQILAVGLGVLASLRLPSLMVPEGVAIRSDPGPSSCRCACHVHENCNRSCMVSSLLIHRTNKAMPN